MNRILKIVTFSVLLVVFTYSFYQLSQSSFFHLTDIRINYKNTSDYFVSLNERIFEILEQHKNQLIWNIDLINLEDELKNEVWIEQVSISRIYPSTLEVEILPKQIIANIVRSPTKIIPVAKDSQLLPITNHNKAPDAPLLMGKEFLQNQNLRQRALQLLKDLPEEGAFSIKTISEISPLKNDFAIRAQNSKALIIMNNENVPIKSERVSRVLDYMEERELDGRVIDANFSKKVLVRLRNGR